MTALGDHATASATGVVGGDRPAWALAVVAEISGRGAELHHDALIEGRLPRAGPSRSSSSRGRR